MRYGTPARQQAGILAAHATAILEVAAERKSLIMVRAPGKYVPGLITEGYASKGFHNKAKSCCWGPMAGFVTDDPMFSKVGLLKSSQASQQKSIDHAVEAGATRTQIKLTENRLKELSNLGVISTLQLTKQIRDQEYAQMLQEVQRQARFDNVYNGPAAVAAAVQAAKPRQADVNAMDSNIKMVQATMKDCPKNDVWDRKDKRWIKNYTETAAQLAFVLRKEVINKETAWAVSVLRDTGRVDPRTHRRILYEEPVNALVDRLWQASYREKYGYDPKTVQRYETDAASGIPEFKKATAADYDLFGSWHDLGEQAPVRGKQYGRRVGPEFLDDSEYLGWFEDRNLGNVSVYITQTVEALNRAIRWATIGDVRFPYRVGDMVHHSDEAGRPFIDAIDFPFIAFFPKGVDKYEGNRIVLFEAVKEFSGLVDWAVKAGFNVELNPAWIKELSEANPDQADTYKNYQIAMDESQLKSYGAKKTLEDRRKEMASAN